MVKKTHQLVKVDRPVPWSPAHSVRVPDDVWVCQRDWVVIKPALIHFHILCCYANCITNGCTVNQTWNSPKQEFKHDYKSYIQNILESDKLQFYNAVCKNHINKTLLSIILLHTVNMQLTVRIVTFLIQLNFNMLMVWITWIVVINL